jgi:polyisoprenoid-binding protein YceI
MTKLSRVFACAAVGVALVATTAAAGVETYEIDRSHSSIGFKIRHLLTKVPGAFRQYSGTVKIDPEKRDTVEVEATIDAASIDTDDTKRDDHLRNADFFDVPKFPKITFKANKLSGVNADRTKAKLEGELTIRDVTKPVVLDVEWYGTATDPWGNHKAAFAGTTTLNRKDFGIVWNKTLDAGGYLVGDEVEVEINIEATKKKGV